MKIKRSYSYAYKFCIATLSISILSIGAYFVQPLFNLGANAATDLGVDVTSDGGYKLSFTSAADSNGGIKMSVNGTVEGTIATTKDTVSVESNLPSGWSLFISSDNNNNRRLYLDGDQNSNYYISTTNGTLESPDVLSANSYGYAINEDRFEIVDNIPTKFAAVQFLNDAEQIKTSLENEDVDVYYGTKVNLGLVSGTYTGKVLYTAVGNAAESGDIAFVSPESARAGETVRIVTSLATNRPITKEEISVYFDVSGFQTIDPKRNLEIVSTSVETGVLVIEAVLPDMPFYGLNYDMYVQVYPYRKVFKISDYLPRGPELNLSATNINQIKYVQEMNQTVCSSMTLDQQYNLIDARDSKIYPVARRKMGTDGIKTDCWMEKDLSVGAPYVIHQKAAKFDAEYTDADANGYESWAIDILGISEYTWNDFVVGSQGLWDPQINASFSICPRGWRMTNGLGEAEYMQLIDAYTIDGTRSKFEVAKMFGFEEWKQYKTASKVYSGSEYGPILNVSGNDVYMTEDRVWAAPGKIRCIAR